MRSQNEGTKKLKVGILTYHRAINYGAFLQAYALCNRLNMEPEINAEIIDYRMQKEVQFYSLKRRSILKRALRPRKTFFNKKIHQAFKNASDAERAKRTKDALVSDSILEFQEFVKNRYDVIIAGSDEIWKTNAYRGFPSPYWLPRDLGCVKLAYAASSRSNFDAMDEEKKSVLINLVNDFEFIGVREKITADRLKRYVSDVSKINVCCDPSFLYDFPLPEREMEDLVNNRKFDKSKKSIVVMIDNVKFANKIYKEFNKDYNLISVYKYHSRYMNVPDLMPLEWLTILKNADMVISTFFHAACFSIVLNTPFVSIGSKARNSKIEEIFKGNKELSFHYIADGEALCKSKDFKEQIENRMVAYDATEYVSKNREIFTEVFLKKLKSYL